MNEVTKTEILYFNNFIKLNYPKNERIQNLINQIEDHKYISKDIICKYWMHIYSLETNFYRDVNEKLRIKKGDFYYPLIKMCYEMVKKGYLNPIINKKLYRGTKIGISEYEYINNFINKKNNQEFPKLIVFSRCFLSFSVDKKIASKFLKRNQKNENNNLYDVMLVIEEITDKNVDINNLSNASIKEYSKISAEEEVIVFPFSCFEIIKTKDKKEKDKNYKKIRLRYLGKYGDAIRTQLGNNFLNKITNSELAKELNDFGVIKFNFTSTWMIKEEKEISLKNICFLLENNEDFIGFSDNIIKVFPIYKNEEKQSIVVGDKIMNIIKLNNNKICSSSINKKINIIKLINDNKGNEIIQIIELKESYAKQILFLSNLSLYFLKNNNVIDIYIFKNEKYEFNKFITAKKNIISIKELPNRQIAYATKDNYIVFIDFLDIKEKKEIKLNNNIIDNQSMLIYNNYLLIAGEYYINLINYISKNKEILSFYLCNELTKIMDVTSDKLMISVYDNDKNDSIIRELNINIKEKKINVECIGEGFCDNKKIENIVKINTHKIITKIKDNPFLIWEKKEEIFDSYIPSYIKNEEKKELKEEKKNIINEIIEEDIDEDKNENDINKFLYNEELDISNLNKSISSLNNDLLKRHMDLKASIIYNKQDEIEKNKNEIKRINTELFNLRKTKNEKISIKRSKTIKAIKEKKKIEKEVPNAYKGYIKNDINKSEKKKEYEKKKFNLDTV